MNEDSVTPPSVPNSDSWEMSGMSRWQNQLLPVDTVLVEEDVTVLRQELETAHHLLQYQQRLIDSLTEQLVGHETHQATLEQDLANVQHRSRQEAEQLQEFQSICQDLRSQLRRQQARIYEYKTVLKQNANSILPSKASKVVSRGFVSLEPAANVVNNNFTSSHSVSPWSATDPVNFANAFAICCRQLATLSLNSTQDTTVLPPVAADDSSAQAPHAIDEKVPSATAVTLELPSFVQ